MFLCDGPLTRDFGTLNLRDIAHANCTANTIIIVSRIARRIHSFVRRVISYLFTQIPDTHRGRYARWHSPTVLKEISIFSLNQTINSSLKLLHDRQSFEVTFICFPKHEK